jgi:predicted extracellular nuclease
MLAGDKSMAVFLLASALGGFTFVANGQVVISQIYGGGGNSGAPFRNDFIELFNRGTNSVNITGWSVQYAASAGSTWRATLLTGSIPSGDYYLIHQAAGSGGGADLPAPDATGDINLSATGGKVALTTNSAVLSGSCPNEVVDLVGYGNGPSCFEGSGPAPSPSNTAGALRAANGCADTDNNAADFVTAAPAPRNSASTSSPCNVPTTPRTLHEIQGAGAASLLSGQFVLTTTNIVTGLRNNGFFVQAIDAEVDNDPATSEALFVLTGASLPDAAAIGNAVTVTGIVTESRPAANPDSPPRTQINLQGINLISTGSPLPIPVILDATDTDPASPDDQLERFEGMRLKIESLVVSTPTEGFPEEADAMSFSTGVFFGVISGLPRPRREPGIPLRDTLPPNAPCCVPRFDGNPERLRIDSNGQPGTFSREITAGATISNLVGVLDFEAGDYTLLPEAGMPLSTSGNTSATAIPEAAHDEFTIASLNCQRFFDSIEDPLVDETVLTPDAFQRRLRKLSLAIRTVLRSPDVLGLLEVENLPTLQAIATQVNADALAAGEEVPDYLPWLIEGNDVGGIDSGFLVRASRLAVLDVQQTGRQATYINPVTGLPDILHDRPPLLLKATLPRSGSISPLPCTVVLNHLRSLRDIDDPAEGPRVQAKRRAQAEDVANLIQSLQSTNPSEHIILIGDYNAYEFNDGYVDIMGTIKGTPTPSNAVVLASADLVEPDLINLVETLPLPERYSFTFDGSAQTLDHILVNQTAWPRIRRFLFARFNADFPETYRNNTARPERVADHDAAVVYLGVSALPARITSFQRLEDGRWRLEIEGEPGANYTAQGSMNLENWEDLGAAVALGGGRFEFIDISGSTEQRFYRVRH